LAQKTQIEGKRKFKSYKTHLYLPVTVRLFRSVMQLLI